MSAAADAPSTCPSAEALTRFVEDVLTSDERLAVETHLDDCDDCRSTVAMLARAASAERRSSEGIPTDQSFPPEALDDTALAPAAGVIDNASRTLLAKGVKVGRYVIGERLGVGGMGVVYAARDPELEREVAIKVLRSDLARSDPDATQRIAREAQAMARISHPNVVNVYDVGTLGDQVFIAMERINGKTLRAWLGESSRTVAEILEVFIGAGRGLIAAHDAGIVHRDFKPDNVLVGDDGRARVTDFGLAHDHRIEEPDVSASSSGGATRPIVGTPSYMAPEQHAAGNADPRTDQFSFAVSLYEALYGTRPFSGKTRDELADAVINGRVDAAPSSRVPSSLRTILLRAMSTKPGDRFATMADLLRALGRDRGRRPRRIAFAAMIALALVTVAFASDTILRDRTRAVTRESFTSARAQLDRLLQLRTDSFVSQSDALYRLPAMQEIVGSHDLAEFGLGDAADDRARLERIHENFRSADWLALARTRQGDSLAIADQKGRLVFDTASPNTWGNDITSIPAIASAYDARNEDAYLGVLNGDDPRVVDSGLLGEPSSHMFVMFARTRRIGDQPRALFVLLLDAARLLDDVGVGEGTRLSVVAPDRRAQGTVPTPLIPHATGNGITEVALDSQTWLLERTPLQAKNQQSAIAQLVLARRADAGLSGLFPYARHTLVTLGILALALALGGLFLARRRDLTRRHADFRATK